MIYECECLACRLKFKSYNHCSQSKCPRCGSTFVRQVNRPGQGNPQELRRNGLTLMQGSPVAPRVKFL